MSDEIKNLEKFAASKNATVAAKAQAKLDKLKKDQGEATVINTVQTDPQLTQIFAAVQQLLQKKGGSNQGADTVEMLREALKKYKIEFDDLSEEAKALIVSQRKIEVVLKQISGSTVTGNVQSELIDLPLMQLMLSDFTAKNNVYLYGSAGTGKTYIAEAMADLLGWHKIILGCNQYTSPLDILGGQTIQGYQEGKLSQAWANRVQAADGTFKDVEGVVLILDELPKIDPNTAGILNEALAKVKQVIYKGKDDAGNDQWQYPTIMNGRNETLTLKNLFVVATGNTKLNTVDKDYEANFKQDLSLQDRFVGSTYRVFTNYENEYNNIMRGYVFIFNFCVKVRQAIERMQVTSQAFVSTRIMINLKATYKTYREVKANTKKTKQISFINKPKTIIDSFDTFFLLFKQSTRRALLNDVGYETFKEVVKEKDTMPFDPLMPNFDTPEDLELGKVLVEEYKETQKDLLQREL